MDVQKIDERIAVDQNKQFETRVEALDYYLRHFMQHIPFENLDVQNGVEISTDINDLYEKFVEQHRGGYCYEMNTFFKAYLEAKGFEPYFLAGTIHTPGGGRSREDSHMSLAVDLEGETYIVDVGFGDLPVKVMHVTEHGEDTVDDTNGTYRAVSGQGMIRVQKWVDDAWQTKYEVTNKARNLDYFDDKIEYNSKNPESVFVKRLIVTMPTSVGRVTLSHQNFTVTDEEGKRKSPVTKENYRQLLNTHFGIDLKVDRLEKIEAE
ncbi:arylamine N-acetyltransferase family protein [Staphylococcus lutrae]|uniref:Arylamine N-acetyltransferase n=1 Tax=Staphylococcus lutrae TaxID=155085 RepID=A0AAC9RVT7_9STAP|nr:arylamine N-acetyltransferase [Staphylococcus lutrae]ARJ50767.1 arylamine N-acetyltransferase [Staphylococcus lutrae]PNZ36124.1 arylamine N-acetyltransferase [Staphylococcus lutrae]